ncbi:YlxM family DNA-binding protein [Spiroplasma endosymbiont of Crioceris asparagi]|uniref:YlxM family DNA-binding protein n=1 Tax=Spiroplasma endosymbiont of Crioceris asparagi TaxID=3066286 RepID=UPI0030CF22B4
MKISNDFDKSLETIQLYDFYKSLLSLKQQKYFEMYYIEDYSLSEIANEFKISKNAIYDSLSKTKLYLEDLETKISMKKTIYDLKDCASKTNENNYKELLKRIEEI